MVRPHDTLCDPCALEDAARTDLLPAIGVSDVADTQVDASVSILGELWGHLDEIPPSLDTVDVSTIDPSEDAPVTWPGEPRTSWVGFGDRTTAAFRDATAWVRDAASWVARLLAPQPPPRPAGDYALDRALRTTHDPRIRALLLARAAQGVERYGVPLRLGNGRDFVADVVQELVDARMYAEGVPHRAVARCVEAALAGVLDALDLEEGE